MNKITLDTYGQFTWSFGFLWHIETEFGNFEWSDPDYEGGDNTIKPCAPLKQWYKDIGIRIGRDKGTHMIRNYCGENVKFIDSIITGFAIKK